MWYFVAWGCTNSVRIKNNWTCFFISIHLMCHLWHYTKTMRLWANHRQQNQLVQIGPCGEWVKSLQLSMEVTLTTHTLPCVIVTFPSILPFILVLHAKWEAIIRHYSSPPTCLTTVLHNFTVWHLYTRFISRQFEYSIELR